VLKTPAKLELVALKNIIQELESKLGRAQLAVPKDMKKPMYVGQPTSSTSSCYSTSTPPSMPSERLNLEGAALSEEGKAKLKRIVGENEEAFVGEDGKIGRYRGPIVYTIDLIPEEAPIKQRAYRLPPAMQKEVEWASPVVMVPKADKTSFRFAIDYRKLNALTLKRMYQLPLVQELLDLMGGKKYYSTMDLTAGFHQIPMKEEDCHNSFAIWAFTNSS
jgi:hypothetical protein